MCQDICQVPLSQDNASLKAAEQLCMKYLLKVPTHISVSERLELGHSVTRLALKLIGYHIQQLICHHVVPFPPISTLLRNTVKLLYYFMLDKGLIKHVNRI